MHYCESMSVVLLGLQLMGSLERPLMLWFDTFVDQAKRLS